MVLGDRDKEVSFPTGCKREIPHGDRDCGPALLAGSREKVQRVAD